MIKYLKKSIILALVVMLALGECLCNICVAHANNTDESVSDFNDEVISNMKNDICYSDYNYEVKFDKLASWNNSYNMKVDITNVGNVPIENWCLIYFTEDKIENIWNAKTVYMEDGILYLYNVGWNRKIEPGETVSFGYIAQYKDAYILPTNPLLIDNNSDEQEVPDYTLLGSEETKYGTMYYVKQNNEIQTYSLWDVVDIIMAGISWAELFDDPSWGNFGWAVLDTAALLPLLPSTAYFRKGGKYILKSEEVAKFAKTAKGRRVVKAVMKGFHYADGISIKAITKIKKTFKGKEGEMVVNMFKAAANRGFVGKTNQTGIKKLTGKISGVYTHEIKVTGKYGAYRIYGYKKSNGQWVFDNFQKAHK